MKDDKLHQLFEKHQHHFDVEVPSSGHEKRFLEKLTAQKNEPVVTKNTRNFFIPIIGIAASLLLLITLAFNFNKTQQPEGLARVSPEMAETQSFFASVISEELEKINNARSPGTEVLILDALKRMETLEKEYTLLKTDLTESGNDKRVIHAMIDNFWNRINVLKSVLENIETTKNLKQNNNETSITL